jgi:senataxin
MQALQAGLEGSPLVLIQGPPGTGKTSTILNLLSVVMQAAQKGSLDLLPRASTAAAGGSAEGGGGGEEAGVVSTEEGDKEKERALANLDGADDPEAELVLPEEPGAEDARLSRERSTTPVDQSTTELTDHQIRLWARQAPWLFNLPVPRDAVQPGPDTGLPQYSPDCFGLMARDPVFRIGDIKGPKAHILVCAPSNSALDEIVLRIMRSGLMDAGGGRFSPPLVRVGVKVHHSVADVSLERLVDARLGGGEVRGEGGGGRVCVARGMCVMCCWEGAGNVRRGGGSG